MKTNIKKNTRYIREELGDPETQDINKDPVIGGADDVHREHPTDDLRDSDLVDAEPLHEDIHEEDMDVEPESAEQETPSDAEEENMKITNLEDNEDILSS